MGCVDKGFTKEMVIQKWIEFCLHINKLQQ